MAEEVRSLQISPTDWGSGFDCWFGNGVLWRRWIICCQLGPRCVRRHHPGRVLDMARFFIVMVCLVCVSCVPKFVETKDCKSDLDCFKGGRCDLIKGCTEDEGPRPQPRTGGSATGSWWQVVIPRRMVVKWSPAVMCPARGGTNQGGMVQGGMGPEGGRPDRRLSTGWRRPDGRRNGCKPRRSDESCGRRAHWRPFMMPVGGGGIAASRHPSRRSSCGGASMELGDNPWLRTGVGWPK